MTAKRSVLLLAGSVLVAACDGESSEGSPKGTAQNESGTSVGSGTVDGARGFAVVTAKRVDPEPFRDKARLEIVLSNDPACGRSGCKDFEQLFLRLSSAPGGAITPGVYSFIQDPDAGAAGSLEIRREYGRKEGNGCRSGSDPGEAGTVTVESLTATGATGTFDIDILDGNETAHLSGRFDAAKCP